MKTTKKPSPPAVPKRSSVLPSKSLPIDACGLEIHISAGENPIFLGSEQVTGSDLQEAVYEAWRECRLRKGALESSPDNLPLGIKLIGEVGGSLNCKGFAVTMPRAGGSELAQYVFPRKYLDFVAERCAAGLLEKGLLQKDDQYYYHLVYSPNPTSGTELWADDSEMTMTVQKPALTFLNGPLKPLLEKSRVVEVSPGFSGHENAFPVFYTEEAFKKAEVFCRKGAAINPLFESGCILAGSLGYSTEGELFVIVQEVYEITDAEQTLVSLTYSGKDWQRVHNIVNVRQKNQPHFRILGQAHAHNFIPNNGECCDACPTREYCDLTNLFTSSADREFHRSIFQNFPAGLCQIFGLSARGDKINGLFTLHDGHLSLRDFRILPDFDQSEFETITTK